MEETDEMQSLNVKCTDAEILSCKGFEIHLAVCSCELAIPI